MVCAVKEIEKSTFFWGGRGEKCFQHARISLPSVSTLLSLIAVFATASVFIVMQIKLVVVVIHMSRTSEKLENIVAETLFPYTKHFIAE